MYVGKARGRGHKPITRGRDWQCRVLILLGRVWSWYSKMTEIKGLRFRISTSSGSRGNNNVVFVSYSVLDSILHLVAARSWSGSDLFRFMAKCTQQYSKRNTRRPGWTQYKTVRHRHNTRPLDIVSSIQYRYLPNKIDQINFKTAQQLFTPKIDQDHDLVGHKTFSSRLVLSCLALGVLRQTIGI
jgi:hypothetical protein